MRVDVGLIALLVAGFAAAAEAPESVYTPLQLLACAEQPLDPADPLTVGRWLCEGHAGMPVRVVESDLRFFVSYGANAAGQLAASQTLPPFNVIYEMLEWRVGADGQAYATILRYFTDPPAEGGTEGQVLVVSRVGADEACMVAFIDARANDDPNGLARSAADIEAPSFRCGIDEARWIGAGGLW